MPVEGDGGKGRATRYLRPPRSKRARGSARKHVTPIIRSTNTTGSGGFGGGSWTSLGSRSRGMGSLTPTQVFSDSGGSNPPASPADRIYDLSSELGMLRSRSAELVRTLRSTAQDDRELEEALRPLFVAVDSGLAECHQADLEAIFGRSATPRGTLGSLRDGSRGGCGSAGGGTAAATERLDGLIAALHCNVAAAGMLADQGERLRVIARWARLVKTRMIAQRPLTKGSGRNAATDGGTLDGDAACASRNGEGIDAPRSSLDDDGSSGHWMLRVFRQSAPYADRFGKSDADSLFGGRDRSIRPGTGDSARTPSARRVGSNAPRRERGGFPIVAVHVLREVLPEIEPPVKAQAGTTVPGGVVVRNGTSAPSCPTPNNAGGSWRFLYSWLIGSGRRDGGVADLARPETPSLPPTSLSPKTALPRITLRVIYTGRVSDMAMLARAEERALAGEDKGEPISSASPTPVGATDKGVFPRPTRNGFRAGSVELVRSEVRVVAPVGPERALLERGTDGVGAEPGLEADSQSSTAVKLQIALQLRTRSPVAVSRLSHRGGRILLKRPSAAEATIGSSFDTSLGRRSDDGDGDGGGGGGSWGFCNEEVDDDDVFPSGFTDAPEELLLPKRRNAGVDESELKIGTDHFLGMNVVLPPDQLLSSGDGARPRPRRRPGVNTPSYKRKLRDSAREGLGNNPDIKGSNGSGGDASRGNGDGERWRSNGKKRPRPDDGIGSDEEGLCREGRAGGLSISVDGNRRLQQYGDSGSSNLLPVRERTLLLDRSGRFGMATGAQGTNAADRDEGNDSCESAREAKRRKRDGGGKGWGWGVFRPWRAEPSAVRNVSSTRLVPPSDHQQQLRQSVDGDVEGGHLNHELGEVDQSRLRESVLRFRNGVSDSQGDAGFDSRLSNAAGTTGNGSADPGATISGDRERRGSRTSHALSGRRRAPLVVTVVLTPPSAELFCEKG